MRTSNIFNAANRLKTYKIEVGAVLLVYETVLSFEQVFSNLTPKITGTLVFKDMYDMNLFLDWNETTVKVTYIDIFDEDVKKEYKIIGINEEITSKNEKVTTLKLQDTQSFIIEHCFYSRAFKGNVVNAFTEYFDELGLTVEKELTSVSEEINFVVPKNKNHLEWIIFELNKFGLVFYQDKKKIYIKHIDEIKPSALPSNGADKYTDGATNQLYKNKIYDLEVLYKNRENTPSISRAIAYDILQKKMVYSDQENVKLNELTEYSLNSDDFNLQADLGVKDVYQTHLNFDESRLNQREMFMDQNTIIIVVNGYSKNDINQVYDISLKGLVNSTDSQNKGNLILGGKYIAYKITDKIIGDCLMQKITLKRADMVKK